MEDNYEFYIEEDNQWQQLVSNNISLIDEINIIIQDELERRCIQ